MKIFIGNVGYNNSQSANFKAKIHNTQVIQNIPDLPCSCCGRKMITPASIAETFNSVTIPLSEILKKGFLDKWKEIPNIWNVLNRYAKFHPDESYDTIIHNDDKYFYEIRSRVTKNILGTYPKEDDSSIVKTAKTCYQDILYSTRAELKPAPVVMNRFKKYKSYMRGAPLDAFETLQKYAKKYPDKRLSEIINMPEIYEYHKQKYELQLKKVHDMLDYRFDNIIKIIKAEDPLSVLCFKNIEYNERYYLLKEKDPDARIINVKELYGKMLDFMKCGNVKQKVFDEIDKFPDMTATEDRYFVYAHDNNYNDVMIIRNIIVPFVSTFEHIVPKSKAGSSSIYNGVGMCSRCNHARDSKEYIKFLKYHPKMPRNTKRQINYIIKNILSGNIKEEYIVRWPLEVSKNLAAYSENQISPDTGDYCEKIAKITEKKFHAHQEEIAKMNTYIRKLNNKKEELTERFKEVKATKTEMLTKVKLAAADNKQRLNDLEYFKNILEGKDVPKSTEEINLTEKLDNHQQLTDDFGCDCC